MDNTREKLIELIRDAKFDVDRICVERDWCDGCPAAYGEGDCKEAYIANHLIAHGVTVQEHGYLETVVEVKDDTVCGNGVKIEYKRCSCCKNPAKFFEDDFCGNCGAKLDLPQPPKGE